MVFQCDNQHPVECQLLFVSEEVALALILQTPSLNLEI